jgi:5-methylcytosine-specific restriction endonuclease McrA
MFKRTPIKRKTIPLAQKSSLKKHCNLKKKAKTPEQVQEQKDRYEKDWEFYRSIWDSRPHICEVCGVSLYGELLSLYIEHLLEKSSYPEYRYEARNVAVVCGDCHSRKTDGNPHPKHVELIQKAKTKLIK